MSRENVVKNASWIIVGQVLKALINLAITMMTARYLGPSNFGLINYAASVVAFVVPIMYLGFDSILVREIVNSPEKEGETMGTALLLSFLSSLLCIVGVVCYVSIANAGERDTLIVCALYSTLLIFQALELIKFWFQAKLLSKYTTIISVIAYVVVSAYKVYLLVAGMSVYWFAVSYAIDYLLIAIGFFVIYNKMSTQPLSVSWKAGKRMFRSGRFFIVSSMMVTIYAQIDRIMLKPMIDNAAVGYYSAAVACACMAGFVFGAIIDSFRPSIFEARKADHDDFEHKTVQLYSVIIYGSLVVSVLTALFARPIIYIIYGHKYTPAIMALRIIVWYTTFAYLGSVRNIWIVAEGKEKMLWIINLLGATANVLLNLLFIPLWGINGAAFASLITQIFTNVVVGYILRPIRPNNALMVKGLSPRIAFHMTRVLWGDLRKKYINK